RTFHRTYACQMEKKPPETAASQLWVVLAGGFISAVDNGFVFDVRSDTSHLILNNQDKQNKYQRWVFESERPLNDSQINHLELVESAYHQSESMTKFAPNLIKSDFQLPLQFKGSQIPSNLTRNSFQGQQLL